jgi:hypothetical protein
VPLRDANSGVDSVASCFFALRRNGFRSYLCSTGCHRQSGGVFDVLGGVSVVAFMLSDDAGFLNGIDILVDGGVFAAVRGD